MVAPETCASNVRWRSTEDEIPGTNTREALAACDPVDETDERLVERLIGGDRAAFDLLYDRYFSRIHRYLARRLRNPADAEEVLQEVFVSILGSIHGFRGEAPFAAWVFGLARRTLAARFKRKRPETVSLPEHDGEPFDLLLSSVRREANPFERYEALDRATRMDQAFDADLTQDQRQIFQLHHLDNLPVRTIAARTGKSEDSVKSNLYRARKLLLAR